MTKTLSTMREIATAVAAQHGFTFADLVKHDRCKPVTRVRLLAMHACWAQHRWSLHQIGAVFQRHHTCIHNAGRKIEAELALTVDVRRAA